MLKRKHILAPKRFDPGKGYPTEHLAYLSPQEMEMLRVMTDGTVSRGPKGLPSFVYSDNGNSRSLAASGPLGSGSVSVTPSKTASAPATSAGGGNNAGSKTSNAAPSSGAKSSGVNTSPKSSTTQAAATASKGPSAQKSAPAPTAPKSVSVNTARTTGTTPRGSVPSTAGPFGSGSQTVTPSFASPPQRSSTFGQASGQSKSQNMTAPAKSASAMTAPQKQAYMQFGQLMNNAPRQPQVPRAPGDAERMARMAIAESGLIRDKDTGKMNLAGAQGVMNVIRNRMLNQDETVGGIISQKSQFSPWKDGKYSLVKPDPAYTALAEQVLRGNVGDITKGADFYHNTSTVNGGYSTASSSTKNRIASNFQKTFEANDGIKPSVYGHQFGIALDGSNAIKRSPQRQTVARGGIADPAEPSRPVTGLPSGIFGEDVDNIGRTPLAQGNSVRMPGRFGGVRPDFDGAATRIAYERGKPVETYGQLAPAAAPAKVPVTFGTQKGRVSVGSPEGLKSGVISRWQQTLNAFGKSVPIVSGYRDPKTNARAGGAKKSQHMHGNAIDVDVTGMSISDRQRLIGEAKKAGFTGVGVYANSLHFDTGPARAWGPTRHKDSIPAWASGALSQTASTKTSGPVASAVTPLPQKQATMWGIPDAMRRAGDFITNPTPIDFRSGIDAAGRAIKQYADTGGGFGLQRAVADTYIKNAIAPQVKNAVTSGLQYVQNLLTPGTPANPSGVPSAPSGPYQGTYPYTNGNPSSPAATSGGSRFPQNNGGGNTSALQEQQVRDAVAQALAATGEAPPMPAAPPVDWSYFTNVKTREQALRELLGEEWYA